MSHSNPNPETDDTAFRKLLDKEVYTPQEAAQLLGMDVEVIHQAAHRGHLKVFKIGHDIVSVNRADLVAWLQSR